MTHFWFVRHGPTHEKAIVGWRDVPADLTDLALIERVERYLPADAVVISSDLRRAIDTADAVEGSRHRLRHDARLREFNFGAWDGLTFDEVAKRDPVLSRRYWEEPGDLAPPGGESWNTAAARISSACDDLAVTHADRNIIVVAHIGAIMTQIARAGGTAYEAMGHNIDNLSVTDLRWDSKRWSLGTVNHIA